HVPGPLFPKSCAFPICRCSFLTSRGARSTISPSRRGTSQPPPPKAPTRRRRSMTILSALWADDQGQDIAEYDVMLAVILVVVIGTIRLIGSNANNAFSTVASSLQ